MTSTSTPHHGEPGFRLRTGEGFPQPPLTLVTRERLHTALDLGARGPLTLLVAPAGTGKTVLLSDWVSRRRRADRSMTWLSGQSPDLLRETLQELVGAEPPTCPDPIVVDDAHLLPAALVADLAQLLKHSSYAVRLVLATRYDLPLPVAELELRGLALTLRSDDLRFTDVEAAALVRAHAHDATGDDVRSFQAHAGGWAAALVLAARTFASSGAGWPLLSKRPVLDLLLGESVGTLDDRVQAMLLSTFGVGTVTGPLAVMLSGDADAGAMLADLAGNGLLVTAYVDGEDGEPLFRYHPLMIELLRRRVAGSAEDSQTVAAAHRRSALHYENRGDGRAALRRALGADDPVMMARILLGHGPEILAAGEHELVTAGFETLPEGFLASRPHLYGVRGLLRRVCGDAAGAVMDAASADDVAASMEAGPSTADDDALHADTMLLRLWEARYGWYDVRSAIDRARSLLAIDSAENGGGAERGVARGAWRRRAVLAPERMAWLLVDLAAAETWADELDAALIHLDEAVVTARVAHHARLVAGGLAHRAVVQYVRGNVQTAAESAQAALDTVDQDELPHEYAVRAQLVLGLAAMSQLDPALGRRWNDSVVAAGPADSDSLVTTLHTILRALLLIEEGRLDEASRELVGEPAAAGPLPSFLSRDLALMRLWLAVLVGDRTRADAQLDDLDRTGNRSVAELVRTMISIGEKDLESTVTSIDRILDQPELYPPIAAAAASFRTVLLVRLGDEPAAEASLVDALNRATPQGTLHALVPAGGESVFVDQLRIHLAGPNPHPFAAVGLEKLSGYLSGSVPTGGMTPLARTRRNPVAAPARSLEAVVNGARIRLTAREADVLDQLALGSSYTEIGQALYITDNTVKTHLMSLYRKLGVEKRSAALRVARTVGLTEQLRGLHGPGPL
ncbi:LuxR C-terminal-related transcriptional regulator [Kribbella lupini]|uniref:HTH luxR-type domain-containing protein n=1 Tax=Kribbella lupini TaxID=291602 RepID=A0ABP4LCJ6_9ACTN